MCSTTHLGSQFNASGGWLASVDWRLACAVRPCSLGHWAVLRWYSVARPGLQACARREHGRMGHPTCAETAPASATAALPCRGSKTACEARACGSARVSPRSDERRHQAARHHQAASTGGAPGWAGCGGGFGVGRHDCWCSPIAPLGLGDPRRQRPRTPSGGYSVYN